MEREKKERKLASLPYLIRSNFIKTTYDISLDSSINLLFEMSKEMSLRKKMRSLGHFSSFGIACLSFSFLSLEVSFGSLRERERETVDNFPKMK